MLYVTG
jgi:dynein heavy chain, axonemal